MSKEKRKPYWETETPEIIEFGKSNFMRCYDKAGKLQFGTKYKDEYLVKFVLDREDLFDGEAADYLQGTIREWGEMLDGGRDD